MTNIHLVRHVKCDEEKPACIRCISTGRKCDGYAPVRKNKKRSQPLAPSSGQCGGIPRSPIIEHFNDQVERRSFHFFRNRTAPQLAGYFASEFWDYLVPLSTHYQPAIRHAVVALASLHERFEDNDSSILSSNDDIAHGGFALQQYNRAISCLIKPLTAGGNQALDVCLVACILFACFEVFCPLLLQLSWARWHEASLYVEPRSSLYRLFEVTMDQPFLTLRMALRYSPQSQRTVSRMQSGLHRSLPGRRLAFR